MKTVEEKAREISVQYSPIGVAEDAALDMANFFKEYLENMRKELASAYWRKEPIFTQAINTIDGILIDLFGE